MQLTITTVYPKPRTWEGQYGPAAAVKVVFSDGSEGDYLTKPDKAQEHIDRLTALIGKPSDFEVEDKPERDGIPQRKIKNYEGKPQQGQGGSGGGGRQYTPRYTDTAEGFAAEQTAMNARTAIMQGVALAEHDHESPLTAETVIHDYADTFFDWLQAKTFGKAAQPPAAPQKGNSPSQQYASPPVVQGVGVQGEDVKQEHAPNPRGRFFALWSELNFPSDVDYSRYVLRSILAKAGINKPVKSREELTEGDWKLAASGLRSYSTMLVRNGIKPMKEEDFVPEEPTWEETE